jgi:hypothetical protein
MKFIATAVLGLVGSMPALPLFSQQESVFGRSEQVESALIGILYDLKQNQQREKQKPNYSSVVAKFIDNDWDEAVLNQYYRVSKPIYATQVFIPYIDAAAAPKAFKAEAYVEARHWVIHYKGQVSPPVDGTYRFVGQADDILAVAVNGETVLVGCHPGSGLPTRWQAKERPRVTSPCGWLTTGDWVDLRRDKPVDIDILVGERPGGGFAAWLLVERKGETYPTDDKGHPILPVFQLAQSEPALAKGRAPMHALNQSFWHCKQ